MKPEEITTREQLVKALLDEFNGRIAGIRYEANQLERVLESLKKVVYAELREKA